jgi:hypothetical protein
MVTWLHVSGPVLKLYKMAAGVCSRVCSSPHGSQGAQRGRDQEQGVTFTGTLPVTYFH